MKNFLKHQVKKLKGEIIGMLKELIEIIQETYSPAIDINQDTALKADLEMDSFEIINFIIILEDKYKIIINEREIPFLVTVNDVCNYLKSKI